MLPGLIFLFILASVVLIAYSVRAQEERPKLELIAQAKAAPGVKKPLIFFRLLFPLNNLLLRRLPKEKMMDRLLAAEVNIPVEDFLSIKELLALGLPFCFYLSLGSAVKPLWLLSAGLLGWFIPEFYLGRRIKKRRGEIISALPEVVDLLSLCVSGGLDFMSGLKWVIERSRPNALVKEFSFVSRQINMGKRRQEAMKEMARRLNIPEISSFVRIIVQADKLGTPVSEVLHILSDETRRQRFQRGERLALQAPIKMLLPLILFILPVVAIIVGGPVLLQFMQGGLGGLGGLKGF